MIDDIFNAEVINLPDYLQDKSSYQACLEKIGWELLDWDDAPLTEEHSHAPIRVKIKTDSGQEKDFLILRSGNSATFAVVKMIDDIPHVMIRNEKKSTGIDITAMPGGYINAEDNSIKDTALRKLFEEAGMTLTEYYAVNNSAAALSNNSTNTSTTFIAEIAADSSTPAGWRFIPLANAPAQIDHMPSQQAAYAACTWKNIIPSHQFNRCEA